MRLEGKRKQALAWGIKNGSAVMVDRLLNCHVAMPEVNGDFRISVNGVSICTMERALSGNSLQGIDCDCASLNEAIRNRNNVKAAFPGAVVALKSGKCPRRCSAIKAA